MKKYTIHFCLGSTCGFDSRIDKYLLMRHLFEQGLGVGGTFIVYCLYVMLYQFICFYIIELIIVSIILKLVCIAKYVVHFSSPSGWL